MQYTRLGRAGARVGRIALGTMNFGPVIDRDASFAILDRAVEAGVTLIDTADVYGGEPWGPFPGQTEELLGEWLASRGIRDSLVIATKAHNPMGDGPNERGLSSLYLRRAVDASLRRLRVDSIDLFQLHHIDREVPVDEVLDAVTILQRQGKVGYLGSSNFAGWNLAQYSEFAVATDRPRIVTEQSLYNLTQRSIELEVVPAALEYGIGLLPWSPLGSGQLGGMLRKAERSRSSDLGLSSERQERIARYERFADECGIAPGTLAIAWLLHQPVVTAPVVGPRTIEQLDSALDALDVTLTPHQLDELDAIWPSPGIAPEAYAW